MDEDVEYNTKKLKNLRKLHGDISSSDDDSDYSKAEFDELYEMHKPTPIPIDPNKDKIIEIHATNSGNNKPNKGLSYAAVLQTSATGMYSSTPGAELFENDVKHVSKRQRKRQKRAQRKAAKQARTVQSGGHDSGTELTDQDGSVAPVDNESWDEDDEMGLLKSEEADAMEEMDQNVKVEPVVSNLPENGVKKMSKRERGSLKKVAEQNKTVECDNNLNNASICVDDKQAKCVNEDASQSKKNRTSIPVEGCILTYTQPHIQYQSSNLQSLVRTDINGGTASNLISKENKNLTSLYVYTYITNWCGNLLASFGNCLHQAVDTYPVDSGKVFTTTELFLRNLLVLAKQCNLVLNVEHFKRTRCSCVIITNITNLYGNFTALNTLVQLNFPKDSNLLPNTVRMFLLDVSAVISKTTIEHNCELEFVFDKNKYPVESFIDQNLSNILVNFIDKIVTNIVTILIRKQVEFEARYNLETTIPAVVESFAVNQKYINLSTYFSNSLHLRKRLQQFNGVPTQQENVLHTQNINTSDNKNADNSKVNAESVERIERTTSSSVSRNHDLGQTLLNSALIEDLTENRNYFYAYFESNALSWRNFQNTYLNFGESNYITSGEGPNSIASSSCSDQKLKELPKYVQTVKTSDTVDKQLERDDCELNEESMESIKSTTPMSDSRNQSQTLLNEVLIEDLTENRKYFYDTYLESNAESWRNFQTSYLSCGEPTYVSNSEKAKSMQEVLNSQATPLITYTQKRDTNKADEIEIGNYELNTESIENVEAASETLSNNVIEDLTDNRKYLYDAYFESNVQLWRDFQSDYFNWGESKYISSSEKLESEISCDKASVDISRLESDNNISSVEYPLIWINRSCDVETMVKCLVLLIMCQQFLPLLMYFIIYFILYYVDVAICILVLIYFGILFVTKL